MTDLPLAGFVVAVTAARRREELAGLLERQGARVVQAPTVEAVTTTDDEQLRATTEQLLEDPPEVVVVMTGVGFRGWMEAADGWGLGEDLRRRLHRAEVVVRGAKSSAMLAAYDLAPAWQPTSELGADLLDTLLDKGVGGRRVAVLPHGSPMTDFCTRLIDAGAGLVEVPVYRTEPVVDSDAVHRLLDHLTCAVIDAVTFTSAPAVASLLDAARSQERLDDLAAALRDTVLPFAIGPVTAAPLRELDVPVLLSEQMRIGSLVHAVAEHLPARRSRVVVASGVRLELRGLVVLADGHPVELTERQAALLGALVEAGGNVLTRDELLRRAWTDDAADAHAVEMTVARLRSSLGPAARVVQTVVKRGYRLAAPDG